MVKLAFGLATDVGAAAFVLLILRLILECGGHFFEKYPGMLHTDKPSVDAKTLVSVVFIIAIANVPVVNWFMVYLFHDRFEDIKREAIKKGEEMWADKIELWKIKNESQT